jgi:hypothetical protein
MLWRDARGEGEDARWPLRSASTGAVGLKAPGTHGQRTSGDEQGSERKEPHHLWCARHGKDTTAGGSLDSDSGIDSVSVHIYFTWRSGFRDALNGVSREKK